MTDSASKGGAAGTDDDLPVVEQRGLFYDELQTGVRYVHAPGRTSTTPRTPRSRC